MYRENLKQENIAHLQTLADRETLLAILPKHGIVAELGVNRGDFSEKILQICQPEKLHLVDVWATERYHQGLRTEVEQRFEKERAEGRVELNLGLSTDVVEQFRDEYFDWIYIDTDHTYDTTKAELEKYRSKIKPDGIIAGHDFCVGHWNSMARYGVQEAVYEFCNKYNWELVYLTMELTDHPSFAVRKRR